jgi:hypothetical protein
VGSISIPESTEAVIRDSTFRFEDGSFVYVRARGVVAPEGHLMVVTDDRETTVVTRPERLDTLDVLETNPDRWVLCTIDCAHPFYCVGFIATISAHLCERGIDVLVVSTFSRDLVFVKESERARARDAMLAAGFAERP